MHFLSHLLAAKGEPYQEIGQIAGDFMKVHESKNLDGRILKGYKKHLELDRFTDDHLAIKESKAILQGPFRRYAGLTLDYYFDHLLAYNFEQLLQQDYDETISQIYQRLVAHKEFWPEPMQRFTSFMVDNNMLGELRHQDSMYSGMNRITYKLRQHSSIDIEVNALVDQVFENKAALEPYFFRFVRDYQREFL